jgi:hypothetical protein
MRAGIEGREAPVRYAMRGIFAGCCESAGCKQIKTEAARRKRMTL